MPHTGRIRRIVFGGAEGVGIAVAAACFLGRWSTMAVVLDLTLVGLVAGGLALALASAGVRRRGLVSAHGAVAAAAAATCLMLAWHRWGAVSTTEVSFKGDDGRLSGTMVTPRGPGPYPGVVFINGSGRETRKEMLFYARFVAARGVAGLAYDKRGTGDSEGSTYDTGYDGYARDALAALARLEQDPRVARNRTGLAGFSEGAWVAPLAADESADVDFVVVWGTAMSTPADQVGEEIAIRLRERGYGTDDVGAAMALHAQVMAYERTGQDADSVRAALAAARQKPWFDAAEDFPDQLYAATEYDWWRSVMDFDPETHWRRLGIPVLAMKGGHDDRSNADTVVARLQRDLPGGAAPPSRIWVAPEADHLMMTWPLGNHVPPPRFVDGFPDMIATWIQGLPAGPGKS